MIEDIISAIDKNLSAEVGSRLRAFLGELDKFRDENLALKERVESLGGKALEARDLDEEKKDIAKAFYRLEAERETFGKERMKAEYDAKIERLDANHYQRERDFIKSTVEMLLGNRRIRESVVDTDILGGGEQVENHGCDLNGTPVIQAVQNPDRIETVEKTTDTEER